MKKLKGTLKGNTDRFSNLLLQQKAFLSTLHLTLHLEKRLQQKVVL